MLADAKGSALTGLAAHGARAESLQQEHIQTVRELPLLVTAFQTQQPLGIANFAHDPFISPRLQRKYPDWQRTWMLPLVHGKQVIGVLGVGYTTQREIAPRQFRLLQQLKDEATQALTPRLLTQVLLESCEGCSPLKNDSRQKERQWRDFLSTFAHDIRNPLGVVMGYAEMLIEQAQEKGVSEGIDLLERIKHNALLVHALVSNYLDLTRVETQRLIMMKQPLALNEVLRRVGQLYEAEARRRCVTVEWQLHPALPLVDGDPLALERVFANLLHNALKFTPAIGRVTISSTPQGGQVIAAVADTGPGIAPAELPWLFEKYCRATCSLAHEGTGLGLFIVKSLVEAHGGHVTVQSVPGQGACFRVVLPVSTSLPPVK
jgi:signal transduction histidine kinase